MIKIQLVQRQVGSSDIIDISGYINGVVFSVIVDNKLKIMDTKKNC